MIFGHNHRTYVGPGYQSWDLLVDSLKVTIYEQGEAMPNLIQETRNTWRDEP